MLSIVRSNTCRYKHLRCLVCWWYMHNAFVYVCMHMLYLCIHVSKCVFTYMYVPTYTHIHTHLHLHRHQAQQ